MDAELFLKERNRMCDYYKECMRCPAHRDECVNIRKIAPKKIVAIVEQWSAEHPGKTRLQDFLERYPNSTIKPAGYPDACCKHLGYIKECPRGLCIDCWNKPVEEG